MPLAIEATPGADDANAFAEQAEALALAAYRGVAGAAFVALTSDQQIQAITTVAADIDAIGDDFLGERTDDEQALEWPRTGTDWDDDELPRNLVRANIEGAIALASAFATGSTTDILNPAATDGNVKREKVDVLETEYFAATTVAADALARFPRVVQNLLRSLVRSTTATWGSATVTRGS